MINVVTLIAVGVLLSYFLDSDKYNNTDTQIDEVTLASIISQQPN